MVSKPWYWSLRKKFYLHFQLELEKKSFIEAVCLHKILMQVALHMVAAFIKMVYESLDFILVRY